MASRNCRISSLLYGLAQAKRRMEIERDNLRMDVVLLVHPIGGLNPPVDADVQIQETVQRISNVESRLTKVLEIIKDIMVRMISRRHLEPPTPP